MDDCAVPAHDDLRECRAKDTLARCGGCSGMQPGALQISTKRHQLPALRLTEQRRMARNQGGDLSFKLCDSLQCLVPAALQLAGDQPVCRIDGVVLSACVRGFVARLLQRQLQLALGRGHRARLRLDRFECCLDAERLQHAQDLVTDRRIDAQAADRNAARGTVVRTRTVAIVAADLAAVVHMELAAAVAAPQQSGQQQLAFTSCSASECAAHTGRIVGDYLDVVLELVPGDIGRMVILDQDIPFGQGLLHTTPDMLASTFDTHTARRAPERVGTCIDRIGQDVVYDVVGRQSPQHAVRLALARLDRQLDALLSQPDVHLSCTLQLGELGEDQLQGVLHAFVRILLYAIATDLHIASGDTEDQRAAARLLLQRFLRALAEHREFKLAHRALHAKQQPIVGMARIVDSVLIDDERADQSTELDQRMPVAAITGKTRHLDREHSADTAVADRCKQPLEAGTRDAATGAAEVVVDDIDVAPAKLLGAIDEAVLAPPALVIVRELVCCRLPDIDAGAAGEMLSRDLRHRRSPGLPPLPDSPRPRAAEPPRLPRVRPFAWAATRHAAARPRRSLAGDFWIGASCSARCVADSDASKPRSASTSLRRERRTSRGKRGSSPISNRDAASSVIHAGRHAKVPSSWCTTRNAVPPRLSRRLTPTVSPKRG